MPIEKREKAYKGKIDKKLDKDRFRLNMDCVEDAFLAKPLGE